MKCPHCLRQLGKLSRDGEPMVQAGGLVLKAHGPVIVCPKCKGDVPFSPDLVKALQARFLIFKPPSLRSEGS